MLAIRKNKAGFTLIEVVLVLAIGGLIFLLAFLAFQQVSVNRRDTQRRQDARKVLAEALSYASNTDGTPPCSETGNQYCHVGGLGTTTYDTASWTAFAQQLSGLDLKNPSSNAEYYYVAYPVIGSPSLSNYFLTSTASVYAPGNVIVMAKGGFCNGQIMGVSAAKPNSFAVWVKLEKGAYCVSEG